MHIFPELLRTTVTGNEEGNMRNGRKIISLLLVAVMTVALLPVAAIADPPKGDTHLHSWYVKAETPATCTERGTKTWKCTLCGQQYSEVYKPLGHDWDEGRVTTSACEQEGVKTYTCRRCGATYTEAIPVTGHDWDEGVVTAEPQGLTPGIKTYTCRHDASHIRTEEIDPLEYLFGWLHTGNVAIVPYDFDPIIIIEQPKDGTITRNTDETHTMHVTAIGGSGNYTYEWHSNIQEAFREGVANDFLKWLGGLFGASEEEIDTALHASLSDTDTLTVGDGEGAIKQYLMMRAIRRSLSGRMSLTSSVLLKSLPTLICSRARTRRFTAVRQTAQVIIPIAGTPAAMFLSAKNNPSPFLKREITSVRLRTMLLGKRSIL